MFHVVLKEPGAFCRMMFLTECHDLGEVQDGCPLDALARSLMIY